MGYITLAELPIFETGIISQSNSQKENFRRLMDMGFLPGREVVPLFKSPLGDPVGYYIMGSIVAVRNDDAGDIVVEVFAGRDK